MSARERELNEKLGSRTILVMLLGLVAVLEAVIIFELATR